MTVNCRDPLKAQKPPGNRRLVCERGVMVLLDLALARARHGLRRVALLVLVPSVGCLVVLVVDHVGVTSCVVRTEEWPSRALTTVSCTQSSRILPPTFGPSARTRGPRPRGGRRVVVSVQAGHGRAVGARQPESLLDGLGRIWNG